MVTIKTIDLLSKVSELLSDGYHFVEVSILDEDEFDGDVIPASLHFDAVEDEYSSVDYEEIEDIKNNPEAQKVRLSPDSPSPYVFTLDESITIHCALLNAIENCKHELSKTSLSAEERSETSSLLKEFDQLSNSLATHFHKLGLKPNN